MMFLRGAPRTGSAAALAVVGAALLWSSGGLFIKIAPMPALSVAFGRSLVTFAFYMAVLRPRLREARWTTACAYAGMIITFVSATKMTTAANAVFLQYTGPAYVLLLAPWLLKEKLRRIDGVCVMISLAGMCLFFVGKVEIGQMAGNLLAVLSGVFFAFTILFLRRDAATGKGDAIPSTTLGNLVAAAVTLPFVVDSLPQMLAPRAALVLLELGVMQMGLAYMLFTYGLKRVPAAPAGLISMLEPVFNPVWVLLGTGERPGPWAIAGGAVVMAAVILRTVVVEWRPLRG